MKAIHGTFTNGQIVLDNLPSWPEGCRLHIEPLTTMEKSDPPDSDEAETPEQIEDWLRWYRSLEPLELTPEEEAALAAWRQKTKEYSIAKFQQRIEGMFE